MQKKPTPDSILLRQKAEEILKDTPTNKVSVLSEADSLRLIHELEVHQVELEMQNEELQLAKKQAAGLASDKYAQLYNFAPTGYFTLNRLGEITHLNHSGEVLLGMDRYLLLKSRFNNFISDDTKPAFNILLENVFKSAVKATCEVTLTGFDKVTRYVVLHAIAIANEDGDCLVNVVDITDIKLAKEKIRIAHSRLRTFIDSDIVGVVIADYDGNVIETNDCYLDIIGYSRSDYEAGNVNWRAITPPEWLPSDETAIRELYETGRCTPYEKQYMRKDGSRCYVLITDALVPGPEKQMAGFIVDITERKKTEQAIRESEERYRFMFANNPQPMWIFDIETLVFLEVNQAAVSHYGYSREEFLSMTLKDIRPAEDLAFLLKSTEPTEIESAQIHEVRHIKKNGEIVFVMISWHSLLYKGRSARHVLINDITERKRAEEALNESENKYRQLIENSPDAIVIYSNGEVIYINKESIRLMAVDSAEELLGKQVLQFVHPDSHEMVIQRMKQITKDDVVLPLYEEVFVRPDGSEVTVEVKAMPIKFESKQAVQLIIRDITQRKFREKKLIESQERLTKSQAMGHLGSWELDIESQQLIWSDEVYRIFGLKPQEFGATHEAFLESVHPDDRDMLNKAYFNSVEEGKSGYDLEHRVIRKHTGEVRYVYEKCEHIRDNSYRIIRSVGMIHDITEHKLAEAALQASESLYRAILEASPDDVTIADHEGHALIISPSAVKMFGYESEEKLIGRKVTDFFVPADKVRAEEHISLMLQGIKTGPNVYTGVRADGSTFNFEVNGAVISGTGSQPGKMIYVGRDITERTQVEAELKASELKYRELFEANSDGITIFNMSPEGPPSNIIDLNENAAKMVGYTREEMKLITPEEFEKDITQEKMGKRMNDLLSKGFSDFETIIKHKDGHEINVEIKVMMVNYHNQPALMNIVRDISERKKIELQLQKYAIELGRQIAEKDKFFSIIAHDLRGPFNGFLELTELMADGSSSMSMEDMKKIAGVMKKSATNLFRLLGNLLEWSRMQRGITIFKPRYFAVNSRLHEITSLPQEAAFKKGIEINYDLPDDLVVFVDENMLESIIRNLTANAVKFTNTGGNVTVSAKSLPDDSVEFSVQDTGIGMSPHMIDNLFNIDVNTSRKGTSGELSTGLGLIICKDFIEKHNGTLRVESEQGIGTTFSFTIPGHMEEVNKSINIMPDLVEQLPIQKRKLNILIAEDEETSDLLISIALSKIGREFHHAKTGGEAIEICRNHADIDLIMMDIQMPEMDGYEATRQIRQFNKDVIIIAQTAYTFSNERENALMAGCNDYITKPISQSELLELVWKYIK